MPPAAPKPIPPTPGDLSLIPPVLRPIARELGISAALDVAKSIGGQKLLVPKEARPGVSLVERIGIEPARILAHLYGGEYLPFPRCVRLLAALRCQAIQQDSRSANAIARHYGMTERRVREIKAMVPVALKVDRRHDARQLDLVDLIVDARRSAEGGNGSA